MKCPNMIGKTFENLSQRMVYSYLCSYSDFKPIASELADETSQKQMYDFLWELINGLYQDPTVLGLSAAPDDWYSEWQLNNSKPELIKTMHQEDKILIGLFDFLHKLGASGALQDGMLYIPEKGARLKAPHLQTLARFDIISEKVDGWILFRSEKYPMIFPAWKLLSQRCSEDIGCKQEHLFAFARCQFIHGEDYMTTLLSGLHDSTDNFFAAFDAYLKSKGYEAQVETYYSWGVIYFKDGERRFSVQYDTRKLNQIHYALRLNQFKLIWERTGELSEETRQFLFDHTRQCRECGGCEKSKIKSMKPIFVEFAGKSVKLCPWYPPTEWWQMDSGKIEQIKELLDLQEKVLIR